MNTTTSTLSTYLTKAFGTSLGTESSTQSSFDIPTKNTSVAAESLAASTSNGTVEEMAAYLTDGFWQDRSESRRSFDTSPSNIISVNISDLNTTESGLAVAAMEVWEMVANIDFQTTTSSSADITFYNHDTSWNNAYLTAYSTSTLNWQNKIYSSDIIITSAWVNGTQGDEIGTYGFQTYVHELGHAIGLGHQSEYNGSASYPNDADFANDSWQMSVMSYFSQNDNTTVDASYAYLVSAMMADIAAIQDLYGAPASGSQTYGDTVWGKDSTLTNYLGDLMNDIAAGTTSSYSGDNISFTIYDVSGTDLLDVSFSSGGDVLDMRAETFSDVAGLTGNIGIATGTTLENLIAGSGSDIITGNDSANEISAGAGNDNVDAGAGVDRVSGGDGNDTLNGQGGNDILSGGNNDDTLNGGDNNDYAYGGAGADRINGDSGADRLYGQGDNDILRGGSGNDFIYGGDGNDTANGDSGNDTLSGNDGADRLYGGTGNDIINGNDGWDRLYGQAGDDTLNGGQGNDRIYGGDDNDTLDGGSDNDSMTGNAGNDIVLGGDGADRVYGGAGNDRVEGGDGSDRVFGQDGDDQLWGGHGNDYIYGGDGVDEITDSQGNDIMFGNSGADTFIFNDESAGNDMIRDFEIGTDILQLGGPTYFDGSESVSQLLDDHASVSNGDTTFDFGNGSVIILEGVTDLIGLQDSVDLWV
jgi:serralysin